MKVAMTGTPGTGKTTIGTILAKRGHKVVELGEMAREAGILGDFDDQRGSYDVDPDDLQEAVVASSYGEDVMLLGHMSHLIDSDLIIVLRCRPSVLAERLRSRGYPEPKVVENAGAEALDVILVEAAESGTEVLEIDTTTISAEQAADAVTEILAGEREKYAIGNIDWSEEALEWF